MHYVCTGGCKGVSDDSSATCQAENCPKHSHPLTPCSCEDQQHAEAFSAEQDEGGADTKSE